MTKPIIVVGSLNTDLVTVAPRMPDGGETLQAESFSTGAGGKGANQAVAARRLRGETGVVRMVGAVGDDTFGQDMVEQLEHEGIACRDTVRVREGVSTGTAVIVVEKDTGENRILYTPGANALVTFDDVEKIMLKNLESCILLLQLETPHETVFRTVKAAYENKGSSRVETILNPAPAPEQPISDDVLQCVTHLIMNEGEAARLAGIEESRVQDNLDKVAASFLDKGVQVCVITLGSKGVFWRLASKDSSKKPHPQGQHLPAHALGPNGVIDTTAAGDTFVGAYAASFAQRREQSSHEDAKNMKAESRESCQDPDAVLAAVQYATKAAALCVQRKGAQAAIPWRSELS